MTRGVPLSVPETHWHCPECQHIDRTQVAGPHQRMHECRALKGLSVPMLAKGSRARVRAVERADYVGGDIVTRDGDGRPIMSVITEHDDGRVDCTTYAPLATMKGMAT